MAINIDFTHKSRITFKAVAVMEVRVVGDFSCELGLPHEHGLKFYLKFFFK